MAFSKAGRSAIGGTVKGRFVWFGSPIAKLENLKRGVRNRITRKAVKAGTKIFRKALKQAPTPKRTGALRTAMWEKVYKPKKQDKSVGVVGPRSKFERTLGVRTRGKNVGKPIVHKPGKILHLVERGFRTRGGGRFKGLGFMQKAFRQHWAQAKAEMFRVIEEEVQKELAKR